MSKAGIGLTMGILALVAGCGSGGGGSTSPQQRSLEENAAKWAGVSRTRAYTFTVQPSYFGPPPATRAVQIKVLNRLPITYTAVNGDGPIDPALYSNYDTIEKLFAFLRKELANKPAQLDVTYDPTLGYPKTVYLDRIAQAADDEIGIQVTDVQPE